MVKEGVSVLVEFIVKRPLGIGTASQLFLATSTSDLDDMVSLVHNLKNGVGTTYLDAKLIVLGLVDGISGGKITRSTIHRL